MGYPHWFKGLVDGLSHAVGAFDNKELAFAIALAILLGAVLVWAFLHFRRHRPWLGPVLRLTKALRKLQGTDVPPAQRIEEATVLFRSEPRIEPLWREYRKHLQPNPEANGYLNLVDPRIWFSVDALPGRGYEQWSATWSGIFLTVGLLFTFIGLSAALLKVGAIDGADSAAMKAAITGILGVSSAKFITSIAGLIAYIGFSLITRRYQTRQQAAARELADAVQHLSIPLSPELLLHEQNEIARSQLLRMERLTDDLAVAIDDKLRHRLTDLASSLGTDLGKIQTALPAATASPIVEAIGKVSKSIAQSNTQGMEGVLTRVTELAGKLADIKNDMGGMGQNFGNEIKDAAEAIKDAAGAITGAAKNLSTQIAGGSTELATKLESSSGKLQTVIDTLGQVPGNINEALETTLEKLTTAINALVAGLGEGGDIGARALSEGGRAAGASLQTFAEGAGKELATRAGEASKQLGEVAVTLGQIPSDIDDALAKTLSRLTQAVEELSGGLAAGGKDGADALRAGGIASGQVIEEAVGRAGGAFDQVVATATAGLETAIADLADRLKAVESSLGVLPGAVATQVDHLSAAGATFKAVGQTVATVSQALQRAAQPVEQAATTIQAGLDQTRQMVGQAVDIQKQISQTLQGALEGLKVAAEAAEWTFKTHEERFGNADIALAKALGVLREGVEQVAAASQTAFAAYDQHITHAVQNLTAWGEGLEEAVVDLAESVNGLAETRQPPRRPL
jgi:methyl-accepting chemotaxis protein